MTLAATVPVLGSRRVPASEIRDGDWIMHYGTYRRVKRVEARKGVLTHADPDTPGAYVLHFGNGAAIAKAATAMVEIVRDSDASR